MQKIHFSRQPKLDKILHFLMSTLTGALQAKIKCFQLKMEKHGTRKWDFFQWIEKIFSWGEFRKFHSYLVSNSSKQSKKFYQTFPLHSSPKVASFSSAIELFWWLNNRPFFTHLYSISTILNTLKNQIIYLSYFCYT